MYAVCKVLGSAGEGLPCMGLDGEPSFGGDLLVKLEDDGQKIDLGADLSAGRQDAVQDSAEGVVRRQRPQVHHPAGAHISQQLTLQGSRGHSQASWLTGSVGGTLASIVRYSCARASLSSRSPVSNRQEQSATAATKWTYPLPSSVDRAR